ncbi:MAG: hypothetical protein KGN77_02710 [Xanthomonadaceae bacterium]|nr:hypothetical protein [Xanthomonadaceae bacterium]MDE1965200.1 hypothetical protein [Xanthomonadaceae bacterium]
MARHTNLTAAGLDLLDRVYRTQILVDLEFSDEERQALQDIAEQTRSMWEAEGLEGLRLERAIHYSLAGLEILLADEVDVMAQRVGASPPPAPDGMTPETFEKGRQFYRDLPIGIFLGFAELVLRQGEIYLSILNTLAKDWGGAPATLRHRLCERVLAVEYPDAALDVLAWLAQLKVLEPAKYTGPRSVDRSHACVSLRAMSLWELDTWRQSVQTIQSADSMIPLRLVMNFEKTAVSPQAFERVVEAMQRAQRAAVKSEGFRLLLLLDEKWHDPHYVRATLSRLRAYAPWLRVNLEKQSSAVSDIAAALLDRAKRKNEGKALFSSDTERESHAEDIRGALKCRGFTMNAQTIYRRYTSTHQEHREHLHGYYRLLKHLNATYPADFIDLFQLYEVALTT